MGKTVETIHSLCEGLKMKKRKIVFVTLLIFFSLLVVGCSQTVSNPLKENTDENGFAIIDGEWKFSEWKFDSFYYPELFDSVGYVVPSKEISLDSLSRFYFLSMNQVATNLNATAFIFKQSDDSQRYMLSIDTVGKDKPLLGFIMMNWSTQKEDFEYNVKEFVKPIEYKDRLYYPLVFTESPFMDGLVYCGLFNNDGTPYLGEPENAIVTDKKMKAYPLEFNANLIIAGTYLGTMDDATPEELAEKIKGRINRAINPGGMAVRKINVLYAKDHPIVGGHFPDTGMVVHNRLEPSKLMDSLALWPGHAGEISIILGHYVFDGMDDDGVELGSSPCPGRIYGEDDEGVADYIAIVSHGKQSAKRGYTSTQIANVTLHELGHYFGLTHTSEIGGELFDRFEDTPECSDMNRHYMDDCEDRHYIMFPYEQADWAYASFSPQQMDVVRMYLASVPHK